MGLEKQFLFTTLNLAVIFKLFSVTMLRSFVVFLKTNFDLCCRILQVKYLISFRLTVTNTTFLLVCFSPNLESQMIHLNIKYLRPYNKTALLFYRKRQMEIHFGVLLLYSQSSPVFSLLSLIHHSIESEGWFNCCNWTEYLI